MISKYIYIPDYVLVFVGEGMFLFVGDLNLKLYYSVTRPLTFGTDNVQSHIDFTLRAK